MVRFIGRMRLRFGLGPGLLVVAAACCALAYLSRTVAWYKRQDETVRALERDFLITVHRKPVDSWWAVVWPGSSDWSYEIDWIQAYPNEENRKSFFRLLGRLESVAKLHLPVSDPHAVGNEELRQLRGLLPTLRELDINENMLTDDGLKELQVCQSLYFVGLTVGPKVSSKGLRVISGLPALQRVGLTGESIDDEAMRVLGEIRGLQVLNVEGTRVTSRGVKSLTGCEQLEYVDFNRTLVDDNAIDWMIEKKSLRTVHLQGARVSKIGIARLRTARPDLVVTGPLKEQ